jgi:hypothetical protein
MTETIRERPFKNKPGAACTGAVAAADHRDPVMTGHLLGGEAE